MDLAIRWQRLLRALAFIGGCTFTAIALVFVFSNVTATDIHWRIPTSKGFLVDLSSSGVSIWLIAAVPFLVGAVAGYVYHLPARMHHVREHVRHRDRVHQLENEVKELRGSLDRILLMPEDGTLAAPAVVLPPARPAQAEAPELAALTDGSDTMSRVTAAPTAHAKPVEARTKPAGSVRTHRTRTGKTTAESAG